MTTGHDGTGRQVTLTRVPGPAVPGRWRVATGAERARGGIAQLTSAGHHRIGFMAGTDELFTAAERVGGYEHALANGVVTFDSSLVVMATPTEHGLTQTERGGRHPARIPYGSGETRP